MEVVATYRGETLSTSSAQVRAATVVGTLELESWRVNERRPATQAGRSSSRRVSSRPQVSKSLEQQLALRACVRGGAPDTNNLLNPLQVQAHMSGSVCWRRHACGRRRRMSAWRRRGSHGQKPPTEKTACYQLSWSINYSNNSCTSLEEMFKLCSLRPGFSFSEHSLFSSVIGPANIL